ATGGAAIRVIGCALGWGAQHAVVALIDGGAVRGPTRRRAGTRSGYDPLVFAYAGSGARAEPAPRPAANPIAGLGDGYRTTRKRGAQHRGGDFWSEAGSGF